MNEMYLTPITMGTAYRWAGSSQDVKQTGSLPYYSWQLAVLPVVIVSPYCGADICVLNKSVSPFIYDICTPHALHVLWASFTHTKSKKFRLGVLRKLSRPVYFVIKKVLSAWAFSVVLLSRICWSFPHEGTLQTELYAYMPVIDWYRFLAFFEASQVGIRNEFEFRKHVTKTRSLDLKWGFLLYQQSTSISMMKDSTTGRSDNCLHSR